MSIKYDAYRRYSLWETLERIKRWPGLLKRFPYVRIYSAEHNAYWRGTGQGYTSVKEASTVLPIKKAFEMTNHCGAKKRIQFMEAVQPKEKGKCKQCKTKLALASSRFTECIFDDEPYESGTYEKVNDGDHDITEVQADNIIYVDICPACGTVDNAWIDE